MLGPAIAVGWIIGWAIGAVVVLIAAALLPAIIGRRSSLGDRGLGVRADGRSEYWSV